MRRPLCELKYLVVHHSVTPADYSVEDIRRIHRGLGYEDVGYHYLYTTDGLKPGRDITRAGAHCLAEKKPYTGISMNRVSIGLCIIGDYSRFTPDPGIVNDLAYNIRRICEKYKIPVNRNHIIGHSDASYTLCPGPYTMDAIYKKMNI